MKTIILRDKDILSVSDDFIKSQGFLSGSEFSQSVRWQEILLTEKNDLSLVQIVGDNGIALLQAVIVKKPLLFSKLNYLYSSRGPVVDASLDKDVSLEVFSSLINSLKKSFKPVFFRCEPSADLFNKIKETGFKFKKSIDLQPQKTLLLDLSLGEEDLLKEMHQKTRYNIRLAKKRGVEIFLVDKSLGEQSSIFMSQFESFWSLLEKTADRDTFNIHSRSHYLKLLSKDSFNELYLARYQGKIIAGGIFSFFDNKVTYLHGASDNEYRQVMAPYLLQYTVIIKAKEMGYSFYDFYGIDEVKWPGVTRFKLGFGGIVHDYAGTYDVILRPLYYSIYQLLRKLRRLF